MSNCTWCNGPDGQKWSQEIDGKKFVSSQLFCSLKCKTEYEDQYGITWKKSGCFIATAVYGDYNHQIVKDLRLYRNQHLYTSNLGRKFVDLYYDISPNLADKVHANKIASFLVRNFFIKPLHFTLKSLGYINRN
jgi:hypothetical protein